MGDLMIHAIYGASICIIGLFLIYFWVQFRRLVEAHNETCYILVDERLERKAMETKLENLERDFDLFHRDLVHYDHNDLN